jgi:hypothetical protein
MIRLGASILKVVELLFLIVGTYFVFDGRL